jgi:exopolysaccharide biosynthesis protein
MHASKFIYKICPKNGGTISYSRTSILCKLIYLWSGRMFKRAIKLAIIIDLSFFITLAILIVLIFYGPFTTIRDLIVTTSMTTLNHKYIAQIFLSDVEIQKIMSKYNIEDPVKNSDTSKIKIPAKNPSKTEKGKIELLDIKGPTYAGHMLIINDPGRVRIVSDFASGKTGMKLKDTVDKYNAAGGINAGGFIDEGGHGHGNVPTGCIIQNYKVLFGSDNVKYSIIGFNKDNILVLGKYTLEQAGNLNIRDAVAFQPFLVVNGQPIINKGDGGWGMGPRTAIGQTKDGKVIMLVIDGRQLHSVGATLKEVQDIMLKYGAFNASSLDGGSSTVMYYEGKLINKPSSIYGERFLPSAFVID